MIAIWQRRVMGEPAAQDHHGGFRQRGQLVFGEFRDREGIPADGVDLRLGLTHFSIRR